MTQEQKRVLLHKHLTGEFPGQKWSTIQALLKLGFLTEVGKNLVVTQDGREYCDAHHLEIPCRKRDIAFEIAKGLNTQSHGEKP